MDRNILSSLDRLIIAWIETVGVSRVRYSAIKREHLRRLAGRMAEVRGKD